jgi:glutamine amidotransferase
MKLGIVNNSLGNVGSVYRAFDFFKHKVSFINRPNDVKNHDILILAGVGNFKTAVKKLKGYNLLEELNESVLVKKKPVIGICLGMQLFADVSRESEENKGFGWLKGKVVKMKGESFRVPHIGWNSVNPLKYELFKNIKDNMFYFMHSYHFVPEEKDIVVATTKLGDFDIVSAVRKGNIIGVQFHPEKSQGDGLRFLKNCVEELI